MNAEGYCSENHRCEMGACDFSSVGCMKILRRDFWFLNFWSGAHRWSYMDINFMNYVSKS